VLAVICIAVAVDAAVAVAHGSCIDDNDDDSIVGVGAGSEFLFLGQRWTPHGRQFVALSPVAFGDVGRDAVSSFLCLIAVAAAISFSFLSSLYGGCYHPALFRSGLLVSLTVKSFLAQGR